MRHAMYIAPLYSFREPATRSPTRRCAAQDGLACPRVEPLHLGEIRRIEEVPDG